MKPIGIAAALCSLLFAVTPMYSVFTRTEMTEIQDNIPLNTSGTVECAHLNVSDGVCADCGASPLARCVDSAGNDMGYHIYTRVKAGVTKWEDGWYAVTGKTALSGRVMISGDVNLILCDGAALTAKKGIGFEYGSLTIWTQSSGEDQGRLTAVSTVSGNAGIGGTNDYNSPDCGKVTINGGIITVSGGENAAGIGGGSYKNGGMLTRSDGGRIRINGGELNVTGGSGGQAIGCAEGGQESGRIYFGDVMVRLSDGDWVDKDQREEICRTGNGKTVITGPCRHTEYRNGYCRYCGALISVGDVDGNGKVNPRDSMVLARYLAGWSGYPDLIDPYASDVDADGSVTVKDAVILARHLAGWAGYETLPFRP